MVRFQLCHELLMKPSSVTGKRNNQVLFQNNSFYFQIFGIVPYLDTDFKKYL